MSMTFDSLTADARESRQRAHDACLQYNRSPSKGHLKKLSALFESVGENLRIEKGFHCDYGDRISFGNNVYLNINCTLLDGGLISIGDDCLVGPNVQILTVNHPLNSRQRLQKTSLVKDVTIERNVWIGAGAIILPGVTIHENSVIAAGSIVTRSVQPYSLVAGNPARFLRELD